MHSVEILPSGSPDIDIFWGEISPCEHLVQIYYDNSVFLDSLEGFVAGGISAGDGVVVIATPAHLLALGDRLMKRGINVRAALQAEQYFALDAEETLSKFMINGWPDPVLFRDLVASILQRAKGGSNRHVRAFGEMVAVLWSQGNNNATVRLEHLWHRLCQEQSFSLFCAYPRSGFTVDAHESIREICATHSRVVS